LDKEKEKVRIEFKRAGGTDLLKVQKGDILFLEKDRWHRAENLKETQNHELVKIKEISSREMKLEAWDKEGNINFLFSIYSPKIEALKRKAESVIQSVHLYSKGRVSCKLDRQRLLLKVGDWLILKKNRWHRIDKIDAYEKLSCSDNFGELLFFEKIEKRQNKNFLKGWVFNNIRTQTFNFEILIISSSSKPKRREISSINKNFFSSSDFQRGKL
jgi:quercetin dioxygenase-like cupin family protein